ncbi:MAG: isoprenylcysteine carboxylmethyltransferase family protein [Acidobacteriaceae bacterium]
MNPYIALKWIWIVFAVFWLLAAFAQKRSVRRQSAGSRRFQVAIIALAVAPFYLPVSQLGVLYRRFLPNSPGIQNFGLLLLLLGLGFAVWARFALGRNWSGMVTVKQDHVLITRGPYAWVRHPIYTGILLALLGTALVGGSFANLVAAALVTLALWWKLRIEERFMLETFGEQYTSYRQRVKALIPYVI